MSKSVAIVYWTGTGNTEEMAHALEAGRTDEVKQLGEIFLRFTGKTNHERGA